MKIFISDKSIDKLKKIIESGTGDSISVRKKKSKDPSANVFDGIKLDGKYSALQKSGKAYSIYISKAKIKEINSHRSDEGGNGAAKDGGFFPLPLILGIIGEIATAATAGATVTKTVIDSKNKDKELEEQRRHNEEIEKTMREQQKAVGEAISLRNLWKEGASLGVKECANKSRLDEIGKRTFRAFMKNANDNFDIKYDGEALSLRPYMN